MRIFENDDPPAQVNIVPAIDMIFAILTYFIMASLFLTRAEGLPVNLPQAQNAESQTNRQSIIAIDANGNLAFDRETVTLEELPDRVSAKVNGGSLIVAIAADEAVDYGRVVAVMDSLRGIEGVRLGISTKQQ
ncbi:ExbD/TolR family protein [Baaleninema simplex]|uniref:ExbD/TolR family protein n=1 Tax=Baaleninema simplex TaxID=2862350 RepID=UPI00034D7641|nr:biopolymer transporter ExbD [Baaleninema simplex]